MEIFSMPTSKKKANQSLGGPKRGHDRNPEFLTEAQRSRTRMPGEIDAGQRLRISGALLAPAVKTKFFRIPDVTPFGSLS